MNDQIRADNLSGMPSEIEMKMEIFTPFHRITGTVIASSRRTNGVLNSIGEYLMLEQVSTTNLGRPFDSPIESRVVRINKSSIVLAVPNEEVERERITHRSRLTGYMLQRRVLIGLGNFEVSGNLHLEQELEIASVLLQRQELFIGITDASINYLLNTSLKITASAVLINKSYNSFICAGAP